MVVLDTALDPSLMLGLLLLCCRHGVRRVRVSRWSVFRWILSGLDCVFVLVKKAAATGESEAQMGLQLNYIYSQIIFHLTYAQLKRIFEQQTNYDLRRMLTGTEKFLDKLIELMDTNPCFFLGAVRCTLAWAWGLACLHCMNGDVAFGPRVCHG